MWHFERPKLVLWIAGLVLAVQIGIARGDQPEILYLKGGDRFSGTSLGLSDGALRWRMPYGEEIRIPLEAIDRIEYPGSDVPGQPLREESAADLSMADGDPDDDECLDADSGYFGLVLERFDDTRQAAAEQFAVWTKRLELGARFLDGNTDQDFVDALVKLERENADPYVDADFGGQYGQNRGDRSSNRWFGNMTVDFAKERKWIFYLSTKNEYDEFENLDYRGTLSPGVGYRFFNEKEKRLITRLGPGVTHEFYRDPPLRRTTPDLFAEIETRWPLFDRVHYEHKSTFHPSLNDTDVFRLVSNTGILIRLDDSEHWNLKLGLRFEHNSQPNKGREKSDYTSSILLVYKRK